MRFSVSVGENRYHASRCEETAKPGDSREPPRCREERESSVEAQAGQGSQGAEGAWVADVPWAADQRSEDAGAGRWGAENGAHERESSDAQEAHVVSPEGLRDRVGGRRTVLKTSSEADAQGTAGRHSEGDEAGHSAGENYAKYINWGVRTMHA